MRLVSVATQPLAFLPLLIMSGLSLVGAKGVLSSCLRENASRFAAAAACGDSGSLEHCFSHIPEDRLAGLDGCFVNAGCTSPEAIIEQQYIRKYCEEGISNIELRRRGPDPMPAPAPAPEAKSTTTTPFMFVSVGPSTSTTVACSTETTFHTETCPVQSTGTSSGRKLPCFTTTLTTSECAATHVCRAESDGRAWCVQRDDHLTTSGLVVTIFLAIFLLAMTSTFCFCCCREKARLRKARARKEAEEIARGMAGSKAAAVANTNATEYEGQDDRREQNPFLRRDDEREGQYHSGPGH
ncbi:hypothetical protein F5Y15DRAFT_260426 [Xylariaceae sp. FL0016]|nr:hypothetical protein F5Y15DRAFT_260426 [Xylariaceae sp. FL0016]